jgi:hypothetical protein
MALREALIHYTQLGYYPVRVKCKMEPLRVFQTAATRFGTAIIGKSQ